MSGEGIDQEGPRRRILMVGRNGPSGKDPRTVAPSVRGRDASRLEPGCDGVVGVMVVVVEVSLAEVEGCFRLLLLSLSQRNGRAIVLIYVIGPSITGRSRLTSKASSAATTTPSKRPRCDGPSRKLSSDGGERPG